MTLPAVEDSHDALCGNLALLNVHDEFKTSSVILPSGPFSKRTSAE